MGNYHRKAYLKHFEGYSEIRDPSSGKIRRIYTSKYYQCGLSDRALLGRKWLYCAMLLVSIVLWAAVSLSGLPGTMSKPVSAFTALTLIPLFFAVTSVFHFCTAPRKMTICEYRESSTHLKRASLAASVTLLLSGLAEFIFTLIDVSASLRQEYWGMIGYLAAAAAMFTLFQLERTTSYLRVANKNSYVADDNNATEITL